MWSRREIELHQKAASELIEIKNKAFNFLQRGVTEYEVQQLILQEYKNRGLATDKDPPIVGFNENSAESHYTPVEDSKSLEENTLVLIDLWARVKGKRSPFADISWVAYFGSQISPEIEAQFDAVIAARDVCLAYIESKLKRGKIPLGQKIEEISAASMTESGYGKFLEHSVGHSLGFRSPHGSQGHLVRRNQNPLQLNVGYTIEPGIYVPGRCGIRSEIDFYISSKLELIVTTDVQKEIVKFK